MAGQSPKWRRWLSRGGLLLLVPVLAFVVAVGYFFTAGAQHRHEIVMPPPGLPDVAGDLSGRLTNVMTDGRLDAARVAPRFEEVRARLEGMRVIFVPSYLSDSVIPSVNLGNELGYKIGRAHV